jgi:hypothetical protein
MNILEWLNSLRPALPMSSEAPCKAMSQSELRRHLKSKAILINGESCEWNELLDFPVFGLVVFPNGKRKTTII